MVVGRCDNAAPLWIAADDERNTPQLGALELLDRSEERVEIEMGDDHGASIEHTF